MSLPLVDKSGGSGSGRSCECRGWCECHRDLKLQHDPDWECDCRKEMPQPQLQPICAECREPIGKGARVAVAKDGAKFHSRCWSTR